MLGQILRRFIFGLLFGALAVYLVWNFYLKEKETEEIEETPEIEIVREVDFLDEESLPTAIPVHELGFISSSQETPLFFNLSGTIDELHIQEGEIVRKNMELAALEVTDTSLPDEMFLLEAPERGMVTSLLVEEGDTVTAGQMIGMISDVDELHIILYLTEEEVEGLEVDDAIYFEGEEIGKILKIAPLVDPSLHQQKVTIVLDPSSEFKLGGRLEFYFEKAISEGAVLVPLSALVLDEEKNLVYIYEDGVVNPAEVKIGEFYGDHVEVFDYPDGELVVQDASGLSAGQKVTLSLE